MGSLLRQCLAVTELNLKSIPQRLAMSIATVVAVAVAVSVLLGFLALGEGFRATLNGSGAEDVAIVLRGGSESELNSSIAPDQFRVIETGPGVAARAGAPLISGEVYVVVDGERRSTGVNANIPLRGMGENGLAVRPSARIAEGRMFAPGSSEIVVGRGLIREFAGFELGSRRRIGASEWTVVGVFEAPGTVFESEIWGDVRVVQSVFNREGGVQTARVQLTSADAVQAFAKFIDDDPRLEHEAKSERAYYADQAGGSVNLINLLGWPLGITMAIGALAGALNTMYSSVAARAAEISTLRIIGFSGFAAFFGTLVEALVLSLLGAGLGLVICMLVFNGMTTSTLGEGFTQVVFQLKVSPALVGQAIVMALVIGFVGGVFPGARAASQRPQLGLS